MKQVLLLLVFSLVNGDMYLQSIRGSNNRLTEANRERNNANRMFDSQNNNRGGYNVGKVNLYEREQVPISWTNQHGCNGDGTKHCQIIVQALCDPIMRDGETTQRIPENPAQCQNFNCDLDVKYGRHESYAWYEQCKQTSRNKGLFVGSQKLKGDDATKTRQNPGGNRYGYECPEERDYWPYWRPSPWKDIAVFTNDVEKCELLVEESENVKGRSWCQLPEGYKLKGNQKIPLSKEECETDEFALSVEGQNTTTAQWMTGEPNGWPRPKCVAAEASRENHLGLIGHKRQWTYNWVVPEVLQLEGVPEATCVLRFRYNITNDLHDGVPDPQTGAFNTLEPGIGSEFNPAKGGNANTQPATFPVWERYGLTEDDVKCSFPANQGGDCNREEDSRDYVWRNNPQVDVLGKVFTDKNGDEFRMKLQLAINTAQFGRTFQDRTHTFQLHKTPAEVGEGQALKMLTVGGKRGNIVQTFPAHEYFFFPEVLHAKVGDWIKVEISGSDTNPNNNDGQGRAGTDRSNLCPIKNSNYIDGQTYGDETMTGAMGNNYPAFVQQPEGYNIPQLFKGKDRELPNGNTEEVICNEPDHFTAPMAGIPQDVASALCTGRQVGANNEDFGDSEELDDMGTNLNLEAFQVKKTGCWGYMSTRNNNFSNRSQKGKLCVEDGQHEETDVGPNGGAIQTNDGWVMFRKDSLDTLYSITFESIPSSKNVSPTIKVEPAEMQFQEGQSAELGIAYTHRALRSPKVMYMPHGDDQEWEEMSNAEFKKQDGQTVAIVDMTKPGFFKVEDSVNGAAVAGLVVALFFMLVAISAAVYFRCFSKEVAGDDYAANMT